jgi:hypothetical protein
MTEPRRWQLDDRVVARAVPGTPNGRVVTVGGNWLGIELDDGQLIWALMTHVDWDER